MKTSTLEKLVWLLIYGGIVLLSVGFFLLRGDALALGVTLKTAGAIAVAAGVVLIWLRSRMAPPARKPGDRA